ncbi:hypothetical protein GCM10009422_02530 [Brevundimonas kwangchunensis]|uniref:Polysaccharide biosynthesis protein n=1 Tax=Brevundimonas kwangchunensis TaxID=322163 RepID=A0ABN1GGP9_9CAUL
MRLLSRQGVAISLVLVLAARCIASLAGLLIIPLIGMSGAAAYGDFSIEYGSALAFSAFFSALPMQAALRGYDPSEDASKFEAFSVLCGLAAAMVTLLFMISQASLAVSVAASAFVGLQVVSVGLLTIVQVERGAVRPAVLELARGLLTLVLIGLVVLAGTSLDSVVAFLLLAGGYGVQMGLLSKRLKWPGPTHAGEFVRMASLGVLIAAWLLLGSSIYLIAKWMVRPDLTVAAFASFTYQLDIVARIIGLTGAIAITNFLTPFAAAARTGDGLEFRATLVAATGVHIGLSVAAGLVVAGATVIGAPIWNVSPEPVFLAMIWLVVTALQFMPIAHKWLELTRGGARPLACLVAANLVLVAVYAGSREWLPDGFEPSVGILTALLVAATLYVSLVLASLLRALRDQQGLERP